MRAIVQHAYGPAEVLKLEEVPRPVPADDQVLVRVRAASVNAADWHMMRADPFPVRFFAGLLKPKHAVPGADIAGTVEAAGAKVTGLAPGDDVFGDLSGSGFGAFAEYVAAPADVLAPKPEGVSFEESAAVPLAATAALQALRDKGRIRAGQDVLINGASGGVGTFAVQLAKAFGATVTGVCSTHNVELVRSIGADHVIDYTREDPTRAGRRDLILDAAAFRPASDWRDALAPDGAYVLVGGDTRRLFQLMLLGKWIARGTKARMEAFLAQPSRADLLEVKERIEAGTVKPAIDRAYTLAEVPDAIRHVEDGHSRGKVVITV